MSFAPARVLVSICVMILFGSFTPTGTVAAAPATADTPMAGTPSSGVQAASSSLIERGKYVATAADCYACHSPDGGKPYSGGKPLKSDFGIIYGSNITQDKKTGIGTWTKADFEGALRRGVSKDGSYLYPAMPYTSYTKMTPEDLDALWAYIKTIPAVEHTIPANTLPFPLTVRSGMAVWQSLYLKPGVFQPVASQSADWNRGSYLVNSLGHCGDCHTPRDLAQGPEMKHKLAGAKISGWYAPDISNDPLSTVGKLSTDQLAKFLKSGRLPDNTKSFGPMQETVHDSLSKLSDKDLFAMAVYLKDQRESVQEVKPTRVSMPPERLAAGKLVYENNCQSCHHSDGKGLAGSVPALAGNDAVVAQEPYNVIMALLEGFAPQGSWGAMASFANQLSDDQIADVSNYIRTSWGNQAPPNAAPWSVASWRTKADAPTTASAHGLLCPSLATEVVQPALGAGTKALKQAAQDSGKMDALVNNYETARPKSSPAEVIEALSTAYCRALAPDHLSEQRISAQIAGFSQRVAIALGDRKTAGRPAT